MGIGGGLWSTGLALAYYFVDHRVDVIRQLLSITDRRRKSSSSGTNNARNGNFMKMIELGSGNGFLSVVLSACLMASQYDCDLDINANASLIVTDLEDHLDMIRQTLIKNNHVVRNSSSEDVKCIDRTKVDVDVKEHAWGMFSDGDNMIPSDEKFDFIFGR